MIVNPVSLRMWTIQMSSMLEQPDMETTIADAEMLEAYILEAQAPVDGEVVFEPDFAPDKRH